MVSLQVSSSLDLLEAYLFSFRFISIALMLVFVVLCSLRFFISSKLLRGGEAHHMYLLSTMELVCNEKR